jgi:AraC-like DNA-binding protein
MPYETPKVHVEGGLDEVLRRLIPKSQPKLVIVDWRVHQLIQFVSSRLDTADWKLSQACQELKLGISAPHAARLFKRYTGMGIREYAKKHRLSIAAERLAETNLPIKVIATDCGYRKPVDFARGFKAHYHISPSEFRRRSA